MPPLLFACPLLRLHNFLVSADSMDSLIPIISAQDADPTFRWD